MIPESFIQELLNRVDVVEVVDRKVQLKKAGANFVACCPFHKEKTPSFSVSPSKQFYHCFGCGAHGSAISFLIEAENYAHQTGGRARLAYLCGHAVARAKKRPHTVPRGQFLREY